MIFSTVEKNIVQEALDIVETKLHKPIDQTSFFNPGVLATWLRLKYAAEPQEIFSVVYLDAEFRMLEHFEFAHGSNQQCQPEAGPIVRHALENGAFGLVCVHNHPAGLALPSQGDLKATEQLQYAFGLFDIKFLDHLIVGGQDSKVWSIMGQREVQQHYLD